MNIGRLDGFEVVEIHQLLGWYGFLMDARQFDRLGEVFAVDGVFDASAIGIKRYESLAEIISGFGVINHPISHHTTNIVVRALDVDSGWASVVSKFIVPMRGHRIFTGEYLDTVVSGSNGWRIRERKVVASRPQENTL